MHPETVDQLDCAREAGLLVADGEQRIGWHDRVVITQRTPAENDRLLETLGV